MRFCWVTFLAARRFRGCRAGSRQLDLGPHAARGVSSAEPGCPWPASRPCRRNRAGDACPGAEGANAICGIGVAHLDPIPSSRPFRSFDPPSPRCLLTARKSCEPSSARVLCSPAAAIRPSPAAHRVARVHLLVQQRAHHDTQRRGHLALPGLSLMTAVPPVFPGLAHRHNGTRASPRRPGPSAAIDCAARLHLRQ